MRTLLIIQFVVAFILLIISKIIGRPYHDDPCWDCLVQSQNEKGPGDYICDISGILFLLFIIEAIVFFAFFGND